MPLGLKFLATSDSVLSLALIRKTPVKSSISEDLKKTRAKKPVGVDLKERPSRTETFVWALDLQGWASRI